jgi:hypothetical protein
LIHFIGTSGTPKNTDFCSKWNSKGAMITPMAPTWHEQKHHKCDSPCRNKCAAPIPARGIAKQIKKIEKLVPNDTKSYPNCDWKVPNQTKSAKMARTKPPKMLFPLPE